MLKSMVLFGAPIATNKNSYLGRKHLKKLITLNVLKKVKILNHKLVLSAGIKSFPTWEIEGKLYPGVQSPQELAKLSNYQGDMGFKYKMP